MYRPSFCLKGSAPFVLRLAEQDLALAVGEGFLLVDTIGQHLERTVDRRALLDRADPALHVGIVGESDALALPVAQPGKGRDVGDAIFPGQILCFAESAV